MTQASVAALSNTPTSRIIAGRHAAVVGGSLGGLAAAHALSQTGWSVDVYERSPTAMSQKGSGLGFVDVKSWNSLTQRRMMRRNRPASRAQGSFYYGDLWKFLYEGILEDNSKENNDLVKVHFDKTITELQGTVQEPMIDSQPYDLVVLADGGFSAMRHYVLGGKNDNDENNNDNLQGQQTPEYAGYVVWRAEVSASKLPTSFLRKIQSLEGVYKNGIYDTIVLKMAKDSGEDLWTLGTFVATPESDLLSKPYYAWSKQDIADGKARHGDGTCSSMMVPDWFLVHMKQQFGHIPHLVSLVEEIIEHGKVRPHPQYEFGNIDRVHKGRVLLLGDVAHMASPRTAVGAHTAILDALALRDAMATLAEESNTSESSMIDDALRQYSYAGLAHARQLYARTREVSHDFVPNGGLAKIVSPEKLYGMERMERSASS